MSEHNATIAVQWTGVLLITTALYLEEGIPAALIAVGLYLLFATVSELD